MDAQETFAQQRPSEDQEGLSERLAERLRNVPPAPPPKSEVWHEIALQVDRAKAIALNEGRWETINAIAKENGISVGYAITMHMALKGHAIGSRHGIGDRLARAPLLASQVLAQWPKSRIEEGVALTLRFLDGEFSRSEFRRMAAEFKKSIDPMTVLRRLLETNAGDDGGRDQDAGDEEGADEAAPEPGEVATGEAEAAPDEEPPPPPAPCEWHAAALAIEARNAASGEAPSAEGLEGELLAALAGQRRIEARDALTGLILSESDHRISLATLAWPDDRIGESVAMARAAIDGLITVDEVARAAEVQKRVGRTDEIVAKKASEEEERAQADANWSLAAEWHATDHETWFAVTRTIATYGGAKGLRLERHPSEPGEFTIQGVKSGTHLIVIKRGKTAREYEADRRRALHRAALETFDGRNRRAIVAMPPEADPQALLEAARSKGVKTLWVLTLRHVYTYEETWEPAFPETPKGEGAK